MSEEFCSHGHHAPQILLKTLPDSQAGAGRHKCPVCAHAAGVAATSGTPAVLGITETCAHGRTAPRALLESLPDSQAGSGRHKCALCAYSLGWSHSVPSAALYPDEVTDEADLVEGGKKTVVVNAYERNPVARELCIAHYGASCSVCGYDFGARYGELGEGFIHVHHRRSLADIMDSYVVDPVEDLVPVCPNCHAMLHRERPPITVERLIEIRADGSSSQEQTD